MLNRASLLRTGLTRGWLLIINAFYVFAPQWLPLNTSLLLQLHCVIFSSGIGTLQEKELGQVLLQPQRRAPLGSQLETSSLRNSEDTDSPKQRLGMEDEAPVDQKDEVAENLWIFWSILPLIRLHFVLFN
ncbi:hypothetical protein NE237_021133 [Protea cynaroides]|uniref:Uncharacterized protein n=1 Tax=Protea cynaroides TaxID=273540 RepID=A0A9Q0HAJ5_9MAGN|nr:hypothetical protein NE237_021133 [Protea cynaroides]